MRSHREGCREGAMAGNARRRGTNLLIADQRLYPRVGGLLGLEHLRLGLRSAYLAGGYQPNSLPL